MNSFKKMWYIQKIEYYLAVKIKNVLIQVIAWMNLENVLAEEIKHKRPRIL